MELFIVKHYQYQAHPSIKGNGFDGLVVGEYREQAEDFIKFVNNTILIALDTVDPIKKKQCEYCEYNKTQCIYCPNCGRKLR